MGQRILVVSLILLTLVDFASGLLEVKAAGCKNTTIAIPFSTGGEIKITTNNCSDSVPQKEPNNPIGKPLDKTFNETFALFLTTEAPDSDSKASVDSLSGTGPNEELAGSYNLLDNSMEEEDDDGSDVDVLFQTPTPPLVDDTGDGVIGEGKLLCPKNWVCSIKGGNSTLSKPSGIVMKAIPYIGMSTLAIMAVMAVAAALWLNRNKRGNAETFGMKKLHRRSDNLDGCNTTDDPNTVTVNMLALNNNPKDPTGMPINATDSVRLSQIHDYSLPDVVTNEGIDSQRISRHIQGVESLYMKLSELQSRAGDDIDDDDDLGSTSVLIQNKRISKNRNKSKDRKSYHIYYQPVPIIPDIQQDIQEELPDLGDFDPIILSPVSNIAVPNDLPQASDYYPVHIPGFPVPQETLPELDLYSDMPPHFSVYEVNETNNRRSLMPPMDGRSSTTTSVAGGSVYTLQGAILDGDMVRDIDAEALYEQIEDRDRRSWTTTSSEGTNGNNATSNRGSLTPLLSLVPAMDTLDPGPVMFANVGAHQRENYDKIDRTKRAYNNKPRLAEMQYSEQDYNTLVMWP